MNLKTRSMTRIVRPKSGHTLFVKSIDREDLPSDIRLSSYARKYTTFYVVKNFDDKGVTFFYLAKGHVDGGKAAKEIVGWYPKTKSFWASYGKNLEDAINGMQRDGWMYA